MQEDSTKQPGYRLGRGSRFSNRAETGHSPPIPQPEHMPSILAHVAWSLQRSHFQQQRDTQNCLCLPSGPLTIRGGRFLI